MSRSRVPKRKDILTLPPAPRSTAGRAATAPAPARPTQSRRCFGAETSRHRRAPPPIASALARQLISCDGCCETTSSSCFCSKTTTCPRWGASHLSAAGGELLRTDDERTAPLLWQLWKSKSPMGGHSKCPQTTPMALVCFAPSTLDKQRLAYLILQAASYRRGASAPLSCARNDLGCGKCRLLASHSDRAGQTGRSESMRPRGLRGLHVLESQRERMSRISSQDQPLGPRVAISSR